MKQRILGSLVGIGAGYLAAMAIAALVPFDTGLMVRNVSAALAVVCCTVGAILGLAIAIAGEGHRVRH